MGPIHTLIAGDHHHHAGSSAKLNCALASRDHRSVGNDLSPQDSSVPLNLRRWPQRLGIVVRKLHGRSAFDARNLADQADGIESCTVVGVTPSKIICQQSAPPGAESNAPARPPLVAIIEISSTEEITGLCAAAKAPSKIRVQAENLIHIKCVRRDQEFLGSIFTLRLSLGD